MKKGFLIFLCSCSFLTISAQKKTTEKGTIVKRDTVKTEVVEVETKYNPEIADATKIKKNPTIKLLDKSKKKVLSYNIFSAPVASTFIPKTGVIKGVDVGAKERIYNNFIAAGFGNYTSPYLEAYINSTTRFDSEIGVYTKYVASFDDIDNTILDSNFSNFLTSAFYKKEARYFDWTVRLNLENNTYNWYGLPSNNYAQNTIDAIDAKQTYTYFNMMGKLDFLDAYLDTSSLSLSFFSDDFNNKEFLLNLDTDLDLPLDLIYSELDNLTIKTGIELLNGTSTNNYASESELNYAIFTARINPEYKTDFSDFTIKLGAKIVGSFDTENSVNNFLIYPDLHIQKPIIEEFLNIYGGLSGDLKTNTYKSFSDQNPYISPTLFMTQTSEKYKAFVGVNGNLNNDISFNISVNLKQEDDKPLFLRNNSKSDGTNITNNGISLKGYEYGNSFSVVYDDVQTTSIVGELEYDFTNQLSFATNFQFDNFSMTNQAEAWNLPTFQTSLIAKYKTNKWYATSNIFYVSDRQDLLYSSVFPSSTDGFQTISSFVDVNLNGGYHFNDKFSAFLKLNNVLNQNYQQFANFDVQGFQVLAGATYKFDF